VLDPQRWTMLAEVESRGGEWAAALTRYSAHGGGGFDSATGAWREEKEEWLQRGVVVWRAEANGGAELVAA
jgi:hypothetical protein